MFQQTIIVGNLGGDPEVRHLEGGTMVAKFSVATNRSWKDKDSGEWQNKATWHSCTAWRSLAEKAEKLLKKGSMVTIIGEIEYRKYTDKDGVERWATDIVVNKLMTGEKSERRGDSFEGLEPPPPRPHEQASATNQPAAAGQPESSFPSLGDQPAEDNLPF
jgi:single-strand DNA-binding protein